MKTTITKTILAILLIAALALPSFASTKVKTKYATAPSCVQREIG